MCGTEGKLYFANSIFIKRQVSFSTPHLGHRSPSPASHPRIARSLSWQADFLNLMPLTCRRWTLYTLSWALLALKATLSMTRTINNGAVVWEYPRFEKQACANAEMYARCDAKVALPPSPSPTSPSPVTARTCLPHRLCELQEWLVDEWACLTEWPVLLDLRAQQQAV